MGGRWARKQRATVVRVHMTIKDNMKDYFIGDIIRENVFQSRLCLKWVAMSDGKGNSNPFQYSCLKNPMDGGAWWAAVHGVAKSRTWLSDFTFIFHFHALEKEMATHSSVLAWRIPGTREPGGLPSMGSHRVGHDWSDIAAAGKFTRLMPVTFQQLMCIFNGSVIVLCTGNRVLGNIRPKNLRIKKETLRS